MKGEHYSGRTRSTGTVVFYSIYFVLLAAALSAAVVGLGKLWEFLQHYEACQIYHTIDAVAEELNSGNLGLLYSGIEGDISPYEGEGAARRQLSERLTGEFTLKKNIKESTKENPVYTVLCGGEPAAFARLAQTGADELYGFEIYGVEQVYGVQLVQNESVRLSLPTGCTAKINGVELSSWSEHETAEIPEAAEFGEYLTSAPQMDSYAVTGLMYPPEVEFSDCSGKPLETLRDENGAYRCGLPVTDSAAAEQAKEFALEFSELYSKYIANDVYFSSISGYIPQGTELYSNLSHLRGSVLHLPQRLRLHRGAGAARNTVLRRLLRGARKLRSQRVLRRRDLQLSRGQHDIRGKHRVRLESRRTYDELTRRIVDGEVRGEGF